MEKNNLTKKDAEAVVAQDKITYHVENAAAAARRAKLAAKKASKRINCGDLDEAQEDAFRDLNDAIAAVSAARKAAAEAASLAVKSYGHLTREAKAAQESYISAKAAQEQAYEVINSIEIRRVAAQVNYLKRNAESAMAKKDTYAAASVIYDATTIVEVMTSEARRLSGILEGKISNAEAARITDDMTRAAINASLARKTLSIALKVLQEAEAKARTEADTAMDAAAQASTRNLKQK